MSWDFSLLILLNRTIATPVLDILAAVATMITFPWPMLVILGIIAWKKRRDGLVLLAAYVIATLGAVAMQFVLLRPRPVDVRLILPMPNYYSFPSGHAAGVFALAVLAGLRWPRLRLPTLLGAGLASLSRVYLGHHYPSDVVAGAILGTALALVIYGYTWQTGDRPRWAWLLWGQAAVVLLATLAASLQLIHFGFLTLPGSDKVIHLLLFGLLAFFAVGWLAKTPAWRILAVLALLALLEEASQALVPGRSAGVLDLGAALAGMGAFGWAAARWRKRARKT